MLPGLKRPAPRRLNSVKPLCMHALPTDLSLLTHAVQINSHTKMSTSRPFPQLTSQPQHRHQHTNTPTPPSQHEPCHSRPHRPPGSAAESPQFKQRAVANRAWSLPAAVASDTDALPSTAALMEDCADVMLTEVLEAPAPCRHCSSLRPDDVDPPAAGFVGVVVAVEAVCGCDALAAAAASVDVFGSWGCWESLKSGFRIWLMP